MSYLGHWKRAMSMSIALFIHAWLPNTLHDYASKKMHVFIHAWLPNTLHDYASKKMHE